MADENLTRPTTEPASTRPRRVAESETVTETVVDAPVHETVRQETVVQEPVRDAAVGETVHHATAEETVHEAVVDEASVEPRRSTWGRKLLAALLVLLLLAGVGLFFGDRYARSEATKRVASSVQQSLGTKETPQVTLGGTPFLTQMMNNRYDHITVSAADVTSADIPIKKLDADLTGVNAAKDMSSVIASHAQGSALVEWSALSGRINNVPIKFVEPDRVQVDYVADVFGLKVNAVVSAKPSVDAGSSTVALNDPQLSVANVALPGDMAKSLVSSLVKPIPIPLPESLKATGGRATAEGMVIDFAGDNVDLNKLKK